MDYKRINVADAKRLIDDNEVAVVDIRDEASFAAGHIDGAQHLSDVNVQEFIQSADAEKPLIVCCYHGHSSQSAAQFFYEQGFSDVYSLDGGFTAWHAQM